MGGGGRLDSVSDMASPQYGGIGGGVSSIGSSSALEMYTWRREGEKEGEGGREGGREGG